MGVNTQDLFVSEEEEDMVLLTQDTFSDTNKEENRAVDNYVDFVLERLNERDQKIHIIENTLIKSASNFTYAPGPSQVSSPSMVEEASNHATD